MTYDDIQKETSYPEICWISRYVTYYALYEKSPKLCTDSR